MSQNDKAHPRENMLVLGEEAGHSALIDGKQDCESEDHPQENAYDGEDQLLELEDTFEETNAPRNKCSEKMERFMIDPTNRRLKNFHLLVSLTLYVDFWITSWILGNYRF